MSVEVEAFNTALEEDMELRFDAIKPDDTSEKEDHLQYVDQWAGVYISSL